MKKNVPVMICEYETGFEALDGYFSSSFLECRKHEIEYWHNTCGYFDTSVPSDGSQLRIYTINDRDELEMLYEYYRPHMRYSRNVMLRDLVDLYPETPCYVGVQNLTCREGKWSFVDPKCFTMDFHNIMLLIRAATPSFASKCELKIALS